MIGLIRFVFGINAEPLLIFGKDDAIHGYEIAVAARIQNFYTFEHIEFLQQLNVEYMQYISHDIFLNLFQNTCSKTQVSQQLYAQRKGSMQFFNRALAISE